MASNNEYLTEELAWVTPKFHGLIIGTKTGIRSASGAEVIINRNGSQKCIIKGYGYQREAARRMIRDKINDWFELDFVGEEFIGAVIGPNGDYIKRLERKLNVKLKVRNKTTLFIQGNPRTDPEIGKAVDVLNRHVWEIRLKHFRSSSYRKLTCFVGGDADNISTIQSPHVSTLSCLNNQPNDGESDEEQVKDIIAKAFQITKDKQDEMISNQRGESLEPIAGYVVHTGRIFSRMPPGTYCAQSQSFQKSLAYQRLTPNDLDIVKMETLPKIKEYSRYDLNIFTPKPFHDIRYKIFLSREKNGELCFITYQEAGINENEFRNIREGPGYFSMSNNRLSAVDLVDPENGITTRINTFIYADNKADEENLKHHLKILAYFFNEITIRKADDQRTNEDQEISIPQIPPGFGLKYLRRTIRKTFRFTDGHILRTSKEKVFIDKDSYFNDNQSEVVDLFFENKDMDDVMKGIHWQPSHVVDKMQNLLEFSNKMLKFCLKDENIEQ